MAHSGA